MIATVINKQTDSYNTLDASSKFYSEREYDEDGKLVSEADATGKHKTSYRYAANDGKLLGEILPNGSEFAYGYDEAGHVTAITHSTEDGEENANNTAYTYGCATEVRSGNNVVRYTYDGKRRVTAVDLNGTKNYVTYSYTDASESNPESTITTVLVDPSTTESITTIVTKDVHGNTKTITQKKKAEEAGVLVDKEQTVTFKYDSKNRLENVFGRENGTTETFAYDTLDNLLSYVYNDGSKDVASESYAYNANDQLASKTVDGKTYTYAYKDDTAKSLESVSVDGFTFSPKLDCLGRNKGKTIEANGNKLAEEQITYLKFGDHATNIPATVYYGDKKNGGYAFSDHFKYKYDSMGNIAEIRENGELYAKYTYDTIGRLVREDNKKLGKTTVFTYDANGNILCRKEYPFTLLETEKLDELDSDTFTYTYDGDKLLSYNGEACEYDAIGNPTTYRGIAATWNNGRQLKQLGDTTFTYDNLGRRIGKGGITFTCDASGNLIRQSNGISFIYDASGVCGICYGNSTYFYRKDILGNIVALLDANGEIVAKYTYDAWGNHTITDTNGNVITNENHIANLNPFRYRGYYYDVETGLYFLKTRYYDPETDRFMTIDDISYLDPESINGLNLYAYCLNNPVMYVDPSGKAPWYDVLAWIGVGLFVAAACVITAGFAGVVIGGMAGGIIYGAAIGTIGLGIIGTAVGAVGGIIYDFSVGNAFGTSIWIGTKIGFGIGTIAGAIIGGSLGGAAAHSVTGLTNTSFWTGLGENGASIAANAASQNGLITIGNTFGGQAVSFLEKIVGSRATRYLWISLSKTMASTVAMDSVTLFYTGTILSTSIYATYELPILVERGIKIIEMLLGG